MGAAFLLQYLSAELRCKCFSGGEVLKAPSNEIVLIVATTRAALVFDPALEMKLACRLFGDRGRRAEPLFRRYNNDAPSP